MMGNSESLINLNSVVVRAADKRISHLMVRCAVVRDARLLQPSCFAS